jgi:adenylate cyclase
MNEKKKEGTGGKDMALEIERKFLVDEKLFRQPEKGIRVKQGYLQGDGTMLVRVRRQDDKAFLTLKGKTTGITRAEFEYPIPVDDAEKLFEFCRRPLIDKTRYLIPAEDGVHTWEVDKFFGENEGLMIAEVELKSEDEAFSRPEWLGREVSGDPHYYNSNLAEHPFSEWKDEI